MKTLIAIIKNIPDEIDTEHLDVYVRSKLYNDNFINQIEIDVKEMPKKRTLEPHSLMEYVSSSHQRCMGWDDCINEILGD